MEYANKSQADWRAKEMRDLALRTYNSARINNKELPKERAMEEAEEVVAWLFKVYQDNPQVVKPAYKPSPSAKRFNGLKNDLPYDEGLIDGEGEKKENTREHFVVDNLATGR